MQYPPGENSAREQAGGLNIKLIFFKLLGNWYWFILSFVLFLFLAFSYLKYSVPTYRVTAKLLVNDSKSGGSAAETDLLSSLGLFSTQSNASNEVQILKSKTLLYSVIKNMQLNVMYFGEGNIKKVDTYKNAPFQIKLVSLADNLKPGQVVEIAVQMEDNKVSLATGNKTMTAFWGDTVKTEYASFVINKTLQPFKDNVNYGMDIISYKDAYANLAPLFSIAVTNEDVTTIDLSLTSSVPAKGEDMLNRLIDVYIRSNVDENNRIADSTIVFIDSRLVVVQRELNDVEGQIETFKSANNLADMSEQSRLLVNTDVDLKKEISENEVQLQVTHMLEDYLKDENNYKRVMPTTVTVQDPAFVSTLDKYNSLQLQREGNLVTLKEDNPIIKSMDQQLAVLRSNLLSSLNSFQNTLSLKQTELNRKTGQTKGLIKQVPQQEKTYLEYSRQQDIKQQLYLYLLQKKEETAISRYNNIAPIRILDRATADSLPVSPNKMVILTSAILLAFFIPTGILFAKDYLNNRVQTQEDVAKCTEAPVVAQISQSKHPEKIVVDAQSRSIIAEQFRTLRSNLQFMIGSKGKVIMITSSMSNEGKSFISLNLSSVLAISGKKVLLLEFDLRKPKASKYLGLENAVGFSNYVISDEIKLKDIIKPSGIHSNWFILNSGSIPPNPAELLMSERVGQLIQEARQQFDFVIIDTPPIGLVADAQTLAPFTDAVLYIVRQKSTFKYQLQLVEDLRLNKKMNNIGIVFNDVKKGSSYGYGYGYGYGYDYGFGYGYKNGNYYEEATNHKGFVEKLTSSLRSKKERRNRD